MHHAAADPYLPFFVYGTLLPGQPNHYLLAPAVTAVAKARITHCRLYDFGNYPMLVSDGNNKTAVLGSVCTIDREQFTAVLNRLDQLEGYDPRQPDASPFRRRRRDVQLGNGTLTSCWVYLGAPEYVRLTPPIPSGSWAAHIARQLEELEKWWQTVDTVANLLPKPTDDEK